MESNLVIFMGVSGCGKSTVGKHFAQHHQFQFFDADDFHTPMAKSHMQKGLPLTDEIRKPWIQHMLNGMAIALLKGSCVLAYSGLIAEHRKQFLTLNANVHFIHLSLSFEVAKLRVETRSKHFFPTHLVQNQFLTLEPATPGELLHEVDAEKSEDEIVAQVSQVIGLSEPAQTSNLS